MKTFFDHSNHYTYTEDALDCEHEAYEVLKDIFKEWIAKGYSPREISHLVACLAFSLESEAIMALREGAQPFEDKTSH